MSAADTLAALPMAALRLRAAAQAQPTDRGVLRYAADAPGFVAATRIYDPAALAWIPFTLWPAQVGVLEQLQTAKLLAILKSRQLGQTWLVLAYILWRMLCHPAQSVLLFSRREHEAWHLLERLVGLYDHLPAELRVPTTTANMSVWTLANGSAARAFPTTAGDSYTATIAFCDEFDLVEQQGRLLGAVKPTIDAGGQMILLSRADKTRPLTEFKRLYQAARAGGNSWVPVFLPWSARPDRDAAWYAREQADSLSSTGATDRLWEQYPATEEEALAPPTLTKRLPAAWLVAIKQEAAGLDGGPALPGLTVYAVPDAGRAYVVGADPAEGNPGSDESAATVLDRDTGAQVAVCAGKIEPTTFAGDLAALAAWYHNAAVLVERNNHGHAVLGALLGMQPRVTLLRGTDGKHGWLTTPASKTRMYDNAAVAIQAGDGTVADPVTWHQLASIDGNTLRAPDGYADDRAMAWVLAQQARALPRPGYVV